MHKEEFKLWLEKKTDLSDDSQAGYLYEIPKVTFDGIYNVNNITELKKYIKEYEDNLKKKDKGDTGKGKGIAGLKYYYEFITREQFKTWLKKTFNLWDEKEKIINEIEAKMEQVKEKEELKKGVKEDIKDDDIKDDDIKDDDIKDDDIKDDDIKDDDRNKYIDEYIKEYIGNYVNKIGENYTSLRKDISIYRVYKLKQLKADLKKYENKNDEDISDLKKYVEFFIEEEFKGMDRNLIISGAPGTGKSYKLDKLRQEYFEDRYERVTFYPNYTYNQFVGAYKPWPKYESDNNESTINDKDKDKDKEYISYEFIPGPFLRKLVDALNDEFSLPHLLIIEEINRANAPNVFGDMFQLLDRKEDGSSEYTISISEEMKEYLNEKVKSKLKIKDNQLYIPSNLYIWCTMNSADQGVYPMDTAFKRRFEFDFIDIDKGQDEIKDIEVLYQENKVNWNKLRRAINDKLKESKQVKEDKLIGPFFISKSVLEGDPKVFEKSFKNKLLMYLYEDVCKYDKMIIFNKEYSTFSGLIKDYDDNKKVLNITIDNASNSTKSQNDDNLQ